MSNSCFTDYDERRRRLEAALVACRASGSAFMVKHIIDELESLRGAVELNHHFKASSLVSND